MYVERVKNVCLYFFSLVSHEKNNMIIFMNTGDITSVFNFVYKYVTKNIINN